MSTIKQIQEQVWQRVCKYGVARWLINKIVTTVFNQIAEQLLNTGAMKINGVGTLKIIQRTDGKSSIVYNADPELENQANDREFEDQF